MLVIGKPAIVRPIGSLSDDVTPFGDAMLGNSATESHYLCVRNSDESWAEQGRKKTCRLAILGLAFGVGDLSQ